MATPQVEKEKKLKSILEMRDMAQTSMKNNNITADELRKKVGIKRYER